MSNKKKQPHSINLAGHIFLVLDGPNIVAQATVQQSLSTCHMMIFGSGPGQYKRILSNESLEEGILFPSVDEANAFLKGYMQQYMPPPPPDANQAGEQGTGDEATGDGVDQQPDTDEGSNQERHPDSGEDGDFGAPVHETEGAETEPQQG